MIAPCNRAHYYLNTLLQKVADIHYKRFNQNIKRHRKVVRGDELRIRLPQLMKEGYLIYCRNWDFCYEEDCCCSDVACRYKKREGDIVEGCIQCQSYQVMSPYVPEHPLEQPQVVAAGRAEPFDFRSKLGLNRRERK